MSKVNKTIYITQMLKYGDPESHHYLIYIGYSEKEAIEKGILEFEYRGCGKYVPQIIKQKDTIISIHIKPVQNWWVGEMDKRVAWVDKESRNYNK